MTSERDKHVEMSALLRAEMQIAEIARKVGVSRPTIYAVKKRLEEKEMLDRKAGSGKKRILDLEEVKEATMAEPRKLIRAHALDVGVLAWTMSRAMKAVGGKSLVMVERPLLTPDMKNKQLHRCQGLLNNIKSTSGRVIFSDEKTWTVDPVHNHRNDHYIALGKVDDALRTITTTKHPASVMSLGFEASSGQAMPLIWFSTGYRLTAGDYVDILETKLLPWILERFPDLNVVLQQDGASAHMAKKDTGLAEGKLALLGQRDVASIFT